MGAGKGRRTEARRWRQGEGKEERGKQMEAGRWEGGEMQADGGWEGKDEKDKQIEARKGRMREASRLR